LHAIIFGATGMIGQGVLRECLRDASVERVLSVGRSATGQRHEKLREIVQPDPSNLSAVKGDLSGYDACFFCLGVSSARMSEQDYRRVTRDIAVAVAQTLVRLNPGMTFVFVSGAGADSTARGRIMWARVKGETENALLQMPFKAAYVFRPAFVQPLHGIRSRTALYNAAYVVLAPLYPLVKAIAPGFITTTEEIGRAMIMAATRGAPKRVLESADIGSLGRV
jgi:uncharacterized protein YbjT (DUF2867 family)